MSEFTDKRAEHLLELADAEIPRLADYRLPLTLDLANVCAMVAHLQLSLRHPQATGASAVVARKLVNSIIARLESDGVQVVADLLRLGDDPNYDQVGAHR